MLTELLASGRRLLAEGSVYETVRRDRRIEFDPGLAHAALIYDARGRALLRSVHRDYLGVAERYGVPLMMLTDTWRASARNIAASRFAGRDVNGDNVSFLREVIADAAVPVIVAGVTGPFGDAYRPQQAPSFEQALHEHAPQIARLAASAVDLLLAATLPSFDEARAIARLMSSWSRPWMLSFVIRRDGSLLDGTPLSYAIDRIDAAAEIPAVGYSINCVHASIAAEAVRRLEPATASRIIAFQGNTSALAPEELDRLEELACETPAAFVSQIEALIEILPSLRIIGGCCGSGTAHIEALATVLSSQ